MNHESTTGKRPTMNPFESVVPFPGGDLSSLSAELIPSLRYDEGVFGELRRKRGLVKQRGRFSLGLFPFAWIKACREAHPEAVSLALVIHGYARMRGGPVSVSEALGQQIGMSRKIRYRALAALEAAGLVRVERKPGRAPLATVVPWRA
jgi:hypothetical protein